MNQVFEGSRQTATSLDTRGALITVHVLLTGGVSFLDALTLLASNSLETAEQQVHSVVLTIVLLWCIWSWHKIAGTLTHPYIWFLASTILYNASLPILGLFGLVPTTLLDPYFSSDNLVRTIQFVTLSILFLHLGALLAAVPDSMKGRPLQSDAAGIQSVSLTGWILFAVSIVPAAMNIQRDVALVMPAGTLPSTNGSGSPALHERQVNWEPSLSRESSFS